MNVYFDNAATTPMRKEVIDSISSVMNDSFGNPSSTHAFGRNAKKYVETARKEIASLLNASPQEIIFTCVPGVYFPRFAGASSTT